jgi:hypothetical protein
MQPEGFSPGAFLRPLLTDSHSPHACSTREYTPSLSHSPSAASPPSLGLDNRPDQEFSELCSWCWTLSRRKPLPNKLSHLERAAHRPDNLPLQPQPPLSPGESVAHRPETCFFNSVPQFTRRTTTRLNKEHDKASHTQSRNCVPQQPTVMTQHNNT